MRNAKEIFGLSMDCAVGRTAYIRQKMLKNLSLKLVQISQNADKSVRKAKSQANLKNATKSTGYKNSTNHPKSLKMQYFDKVFAGGGYNLLVVDKPNGLNIYSISKSHKFWSNLKISNIIKQVNKFKISNWSGGKGKRRNPLIQQIRSTFEMLIQELCSVLFFQRSCFEISVLKKIKVLVQRKAMVTPTLSKDYLQKIILVYH